MMMIEVAGNPTSQVIKKLRGIRVSDLTIQPMALGLSGRKLTNH